jgi:hypothetical protein
MTESIDAPEAEEGALEVHALPIVIDRPFRALKTVFAQPWSVDYDGYAASGDSRKGNENTGRVSHDHCHSVGGPGAWGTKAEDLEMETMAGSDNPWAASVRHPLDVETRGVEPCSTPGGGVT